MKEKAMDEAKGVPEGDSGDGKREFRLLMRPAVLGVTHAELYSLISAGYEFYGVLPIARPVTAAERLNPKMPTTVQTIVEPMVVFMGPADAPEVILRGPNSAIAD